MGGVNAPLKQNYTWHRALLTRPTKGRSGGGCGLMANWPEQIGGKYHNKIYLKKALVLPSCGLDVCGL
jgi:hypothetical protein